MRDVVRIFAATLALGALAVLSVDVAGTVWAIPTGCAVAILALWLVFHEDRARRNLELWERRERLRDERERRAA